MTGNPSDEPMNAPSPGGALCWLVDLVLLIASNTPAAYVLPFVLNPVLGVLVSIYLTLTKGAVGLPLLTYSIYKLKKRTGECWPIWKGLYCCWRGGKPWRYVLLRY